MGKKNQQHALTRISGKVLVVITVASLLFGILIFCLLITPELAKKKDPIRIVYDGQPRLGKRSAPVKIMEFADFKCPACKTFHDKVLPRLKKDFIDTGIAQMYFTNFQWMGEDSILAGIIGESIFRQSDALFWKYYDIIYTNQKDEHKNWATPEFLFELIEEHIPGVDMNQVLTDLEDKNTYEKVVLSEYDVARKLNIDEVPAIFINGKKIKDPLDYSEIKRAVEENQK